MTRLIAHNDLDLGEMLQRARAVTVGGHSQLPLAVGELLEGMRFPLPVVYGGRSGEGGGQLNDD